MSETTDLSHKFPYPEFSFALVHHLSGNEFETLREDKAHGAFMLEQGNMKTNQFRRVYGMWLEMYGQRKWFEHEDLEVFSEVYRQTRPEYLSAHLKIEGDEPSD